MGIEPLWAVRGKRSVVKCVLNTDESRVELLLLHDENLTDRQSFPDAAAAKNKAGELRQRLLDTGWTLAS